MTLRAMRACLCGLLLLAVTRPALAQSLEIIELRHRPAAELIPVLQPLLEQGGALSGNGFQLFVRASPGNLAQIRQVVASMDRAARQLVIQVRHELSAQERRLDARGEVALSPGGSRVGVAAGESTSRSSGGVAQQVRTQEGTPAFISTGSSVLVPSRTVRRTVNGVVVQDTSIERPIVTGFYATPRVSGDTVFLDLSTQRDTPGRLGPGSAAISRTATTVSGKLGQWIEVSGASQSASGDASGMLSRSSQEGSRGERLYLRVDEAK